MSNRPAPGPSGGSLGPELADAGLGAMTPPASSPQAQRPEPPPGVPGARPSGAPPPRPQPAAGDGPPLGPSLDPPVQDKVEQANLLFFGMLAPVVTTLTWSGHVWDVSLHILNVEEENKVASYVVRQPVEQKIMAEAMLRLSYSLREINGEPVTFGQPSPAAELRAKMEWIATWPATLLDAAIRSYAYATAQPSLHLQEMVDDPNSTAAPS